MAVSIAQAYAETAGDWRVFTLERCLPPDCRQLRDENDVDDDDDEDDDDDDRDNDDGRSVGR